MKFDSSIWHPFTQHQVEDKPLKVIRAEKSHLYLDNGTKLLDLISSWWVNLHGHSHPKIAKAIYDQASSLEHVIFAGFTHEPAETLAEELLKALPSHFGKVFFSDNGSTAVEVALKMAVQSFWNQGEERTNFLAFNGGYHGDTFGAMSVGSKTLFNEPYSNLLFHVDRIPYPGTFWSDVDYEKREDQALECLKKILKEKGEKIAALIVEPLVQGVAGMQMAPENFFEKVETLIRPHGILLIFDEIMTGFGRTGQLFALESTSCQPDFICLSKGLTGGFLPLAVTVTTDKIYNHFLSSDYKKSFNHGHSYTANPLGCAAALASLKLLREEKAYKKLSQALQKKGKEFADNYSLKRARGRGSIFAFDLGKSHYGNQRGKKYQKALQDEGILIRPLGDTVYLMPPYCLEEPELDEVFNLLGSNLKKLER